MYLFDYFCQRAESKKTPRAKRIRTQTNRFGTENMSENHNAFFENTLSQSSSIDSLRTEKSNGNSANTLACDETTNQIGTRQFSEDHNAFFENALTKSPTIDLSQTESNGLVNVSCRENTTQIASDTTNEMLRALMVKMNSIEDFLIKINVKLDFVRQEKVQTSKKNSSEIDISTLKQLGLPAESAENVDQLEENLKDDNFKDKLVSECVCVCVCVFIQKFTNFDC